jgi:hypothetical protein
MRRPDVKPISLLSALTLFVSCFAVACEVGYYASNNQSPTNVGSSKTPSTICDGRTKIEDSKGFEIPKLDLDRPKVKDHVSSRKYLGNDILISTFEPLEAEVDSFKIPQELFGLTDKGWRIHNIAQYKIHEKIFQYTVIASRSGINAMTEYVYTDTNGDGTFDTVCQREGAILPEVPTWVVETVNGPD